MKSLNLFIPAMGRVNTLNRDGSEIRLSALLKNWVGQHNILLMMPSRQLNVFKEQGVPTDQCEIKILQEPVKSESEHLFNILAIYLIRMIQCLFKKYPKNIDIIYCPSDFIFDLFPALICKTFNRKSRLLVCFFLIAPNPLRKFLDDRFMLRSLPTTRSIIYFFCQKLSFVLANIFGAEILVLNKLDYHSIDVPCNKRKLVTMGIDIKKNEIIKLNAHKKFDCIFVGRLHPQKGLLEMLQVCELVAKKYPSFHCKVVGGGSIVTIEWVNAKIKELGLEKNIEYCGFKYGTEKDYLIAEAKIFMMTSSYESFGSTIIEALSLGTDVVAFKLPVFHSLFGNKLCYADIGDCEAFAENIITKLNKIHNDTEKKADAKQFLKQFDWEHIAEKELS